MSGKRAAFATVAGLALALAGATAAMAAGSPTPSPTPIPSASVSASPSPTPVTAPSDSVTGGASYPGNPESEALLTDDENQRLIDVRSIVNEADITGASKGGPYRLVTGNTYTLVLTARTAPYTFDDLLALEPSTLVRQPGGSYLLGENIVVEAGAALDIASETGLVLRMSSTKDAFTSIVTLGGSLAISGTASHPVRVSSWDPTIGAVDNDTTNGRSYIRVIGGNARLSFASFDHLGFWSGTTGGVSLTGTQQATAAQATGQAAPDAATGAGPATGGGGSSTSTGATTGGTKGSTPKIYGHDLLPTSGAGAGTLALAPDLTGYSYVSAAVQNVTFTSDAFGLFVSSAQGVAVSHVSVSKSLVDGIVFHRNVVNSTITNTTSTGNAVDGIILTRATSGVDLNTITASDNGRNGITIEGGALATGPSATGISTAVYGNNGVTNSSANDNGHYGIAIVGGKNMRVTGNTAKNNVSGIVVSAGASGTSIRNNLVENSVKQGIALRDAGSNALVQGNTVDTANIAIYARDAGGTFSHNTIENSSSHAITLVGATGVSRVSENSASGVGYSAIDVARTEQAVVSANNVEHWRNTKPLDVILRGIFQPLTIMWIVIGLVVLFSAATSIGRSGAGMRHPYANLAPLSSFTKGVASPEEARAGRSLGQAT